MRVEILPVEGLPEVLPGDDLAAMVAACAADGGPGLQDGDVVVVAQKVVSKAEGALVTVDPGDDLEVVRRSLALERAQRVVVEAAHVVVVETSHGLVCAQGGIDASNVRGRGLALLPDDPDDSAARLRARLAEVAGADVAVLVTDTFGRPWRVGLTEVAIGAAGFAVLRDERGTPDREGARLAVTLVAVADEVAAAADLVRRGKADGIAVVVVRGLGDLVGAGGPVGEGVGAAALVRALEDDLFPHGRGWLAAALASPAAAGPAERRGLPAPDEVALVLAAARRASGVEVVFGPRGSFDVPAGDAFACGLAVASIECALLDLGYRTSRTVLGGDVVIEAVPRR